MKGLLLREYYVMKPFMLRFVITAVMFSGVFILTSKLNVATIPVLVPIIFGTSVSTLMALDEQSKWDIQVLTMPYTRKQIVWSLYLYVIIGTLIGVLCSTGIVLIISLFVKEISLDLIFINTTLGLFISFFYSFLLIPIAYKMGTKSISIIMMIVYIVPVAIGALVLKLVGLEYMDSYGELVLSNIAIIAPIVIVVMMIISVFISIRIYSKKEF